MKRILIFSFLIFSGIILFTCQMKEPRGFEIASTPPMGYNSWNSFGFEINEYQVKEIADYMAEHMLEYGWEYLVIDMGWYYPAEMIANENQRPNPPHTIDSWGRLIPDTIKFPSAADGNGFKPLADYVHARGLKFGIHIMRGIPWDAVAQNLPVKGTEFRAQDIAVMADTCEWNKSMKGVNTAHTAGQAYYNSLFDLYTQWGVDYIKVDDIARPYNASNIEAVRKAIDQSGRPMVLSLSPGPSPLDQAEHLKQYANLWRISNDLWDHWEFIPRQLNYCRQWYRHITPGHWPDIDMLPLGKLRLTGGDEWVASLLYDDYENIGNEFTRFTPDEQLTLMNLMAIFRSPLMMGGYLPDNDPWTLALLTNRDVLYVNQHSSKNREVAYGDDWSVWAASDPASDDIFVALFNLADGKQNVSIPINKLGTTDPYEAIDVWNGNPSGRFTETINVMLEPHASVLYRLKRI